MRSLHRNLGGLALELGYTFGALRDIAAKVADPIAIVREAGLSAALISTGVYTHKPAFEWSIHSVTLVLWLAGRTADKDLTLEAVQEACCEAGFAAAFALADEYVAGAISGGPKESAGSTSEGSASGE